MIHEKIAREKLKVFLLSTLWSPMERLRLLRKDASAYKVETFLKFYDFSEYAKNKLKVVGMENDFNKATRSFTTIKGS